MLWSSLIFLWIAFSLRCGVDSKGQKRASFLAVLLLIYGAASTWIYFQGGFEIFISAYIMTIASVAITSGIHLAKSEVRHATLPFILGGLGFYIGGALLLWVPEQVLCGNRVHDRHHSALLDLPVPLHAFFHLTSSAGPICWLTFAAFESLHLENRKPWVRYVSRYEVGFIPVPEVLSNAERAV